LLSDADRILSEDMRPSVSEQKVYTSVLELGREADMEGHEK